MEPLTVEMTDEQAKRKQEQQKAKAPPPGTSRILSRANREQKKQHANNTKGANNLPIPKRSNQNVTQEAAQQHQIVQEELKSTKISTTKTNDTLKETTEFKSSPKHNEVNSTPQNEFEEWQNLAEELNPGNFSAV
jgi:hypothetical protein